MLLALRASVPERASLGLQVSVYLPYFDIKQRHIIIVSEVCRHLALQIDHALIVGALVRIHSPDSKNYVAFK